MIEKLTKEDNDSILATNVRDVVELNQSAVPHLIETEGCIVNISSAAGIIPVPYFIAYSMNEPALEHFTKCVAMYSVLEHMIKSPRFFFQ